MWNRLSRLALTVFLFLMLAHSSSVLANPSPSDLVISEVMYNTYYANGNDETPYEWIEIFNKGSTVLTITSDWKLCDDSSNSNCISFPGTTVLQPGEYWLIVKDGSTAPNEVNLTGTYNSSRTIVMGNWRPLANGGDVVRIYKGDPTAPGNLMDCVSWGSNNTDCTGTGGYGGGTDTTKSGAGQGQSISKIGTEWDYSEQVSGQTYGGSPYGSNTWNSGPTVITLSTFNARGVDGTGTRTTTVVSARWWLALGVFIAGAGVVAVIRRWVQ